jgi:CAAX protease family protein
LELIIKLPISFREESQKLNSAIRSLDFRVVVVFISIAILQTISWYFTSRRFFRINLFDYFQDDKNVYLIEYLYWFVGDFFTLLVLPVLIIIFILKVPVKEFGFKFGDYKTGFFLSILFLLLMLPFLWLVSANPEFISKYPHLQSTRTDWAIFFIYELGMLVYMFSWEFIWRGFTLFGLEKKFGYYAVLIQMIPFVILHNGKPEIETFSAILGGIILGILAFRTRSFYYGFITHIGIMFSIDLICILRFRTGVYGIGFDSFFKILSKLF